MDEDHDRHRLSAALRLPDVEEQAVLALRADPCPGLVADMRLDAGGAEGGSSADSLPVRSGLWCAPAKRADGRRRIGNAAVDREVSNALTLNHTAVELRCRRSTRSGNRTA